MKKFYAWLNAALVLLVIFWNYYSNAGRINGNTVADISDKYANLFTPAGYAFAIWGIIFIGLLVLVVTQLRMAFNTQSNDRTILQIGPWLAIANLANMAWLWFWLNEQSAVSIFVMVILLIALLQCILKLQIAQIAADKTIRYLIWAPISLYGGWITVALVANVSAHLAHIGWSVLFPDWVWAIIMISVAALINFYMLFVRDMYVFVMVGVWALLAITYRHAEENETLQVTALVWAILLIVTGVFRFVKRQRQ